MKNPIIFLFFLILVYSCIESHIYYNIPENMKTLLQNNDTLYFKDTINNKVDSFYLKTFYYIESRENSSQEHNSIFYNIYNKKTTFSGFRIRQASKFYSIYIEGKSNKNSLEAYVSDTLNLYVLSNKKMSFHDVLVLKSNSDMPDSLPNKVYYTYKYGIVRYEYKDGRKYEIMNNLMAK